MVRGAGTIEEEARAVEEPRDDIREGDNPKISSEDIS
jgi:hypothetical protein